MAGEVPILPGADISMIDCDVVERVQVVTNPLGGSVIAWGLRSEFAAAHTGPFHFYVDFGRSASNEWEVLNQTPVVDDCFFTDPCQRHFDQLADFYYRVRLVLPGEADPVTGECPVFVSQPQQANGLWCKRDWLIARKILANEIRLQDKRTTTTSRGVLLKRRRYGQRSETTLEFDTDEVQSTQSTLDFGTGLVGGYFRAIDYRVTFDAPWRREFTKDPTVGTRNDVVRTGRAIAYPYVEHDDVFHRLDNGERYYLKKVDTIVEVGNIPLVVKLELRLAPVTDTAYKIPLSGGSSSAPTPSSSVSSSVSSTTPESCGPTARLNDVGEW